MVSNVKKLSIFGVFVLGLVVVFAKNLPGTQPELRLEDLFVLTATDENLVNDCLTENDKPIGFLKKSTDIICMLQASDDELSDSEKCLVECIARKHNLTSNGLINNVAIMDKAQLLFPDWTSQKLRGAARIGSMCAMQNIFSYGLVTYTGTFESKNDLCRSAWIGLKCLQDPIMAEQNIQITKCA